MIGGVRERAEQRAAAAATWACAVAAASLGQAGPGVLVWWAMPFQPAYVPAASICPWPG